jgi:methyl-accepting chemotaxis protein
MRIPFIEKINNKINQIIKNFDNTANDLSSTLKESIGEISNSLQITTENLNEVSKSFLETAKIISNSLETATDNLNKVSESFLITAKSLDHTSKSIENALLESTNKLNNATDGMDKSLKDATSSMNESLTNFTTETNASVKDLVKMFERAVIAIEDLKKEATEGGIKVKADPTSISLVPKGKGMISRLADGVSELMTPKKKPE